MRLGKILMLAVLAHCVNFAYGQNDIKYKFSILDTPYGDYFGELILYANENYKSGILLDEENNISPVKVLKFNDEKLDFKAYI